MRCTAYIALARRGTPTCSGLIKPFEVADWTFRNVSHATRLASAATWTAAMRHILASLG